MNIGNIETPDHIGDSTEMVSGQWTVEPLIKSDGQPWPGLAWIMDGDKKVVSMNDQEAKGVCKRHNASLAQLRASLAAAESERDEFELRLLAQPADWIKDSSLETWFPLTAQQLAQSQAREREALAACAKKDSKMRTAQGFIAPMSGDLDIDVALRALDEALAIKPKK